MLLRTEANALKVSPLPEVELKTSTAMAIKTLIND